jgi:hypothetical protein
VNLKNFFAELKRRNVYKVSVTYAIGPLPLTPALLRLDPMFDPLRNDPRFQKLVASPTPKNQ